MYGAGSIGRHILVDMYGLGENFEDIDLVERILTDAVNSEGFSILSTQLKKFEPQGMSILILFIGSHLSIHTWPEEDYAAIDIFTCGTNNPDKVLRGIIDELQPQWTDIRYLGRGKKRS